MTEQRLSGLAAWRALVALLNGSDAFSWYIRQDRVLTLIHGSIAAVVVFLLWIYVSSVILIYGAEFTAAYARLRRRRPADMPEAQAPRA